MKRFVVLTAFLSITVSAAPSRAQNEETFITSRLWHLAELPGWFFVWTAIHEGNHWLAATAAGNDCFIEPYPHGHDRVYRYGDTHCKGQNLTSVNGISSVAPSLADILVFTTSDILLTRGDVRPESFAGGLLFTGGMLAPWLDFTFNANNYSAYGDFSFFCADTSIPRWAAAIFTNTLAVAGAWRMYETFKSVFFKRRRPSRDPVTLVPFFSQGTGISVIGQF